MPLKLLKAISQPLLVNIGPPHVAHLQLISIMSPGISCLERSKIPGQGRRWRQDKCGHRDRCEVKEYSGYRSPFAKVVADFTIADISVVRIQYASPFVPLISYLNYSIRVYGYCFLSYHVAIVFHSLIIPSFKLLDLMLTCCCSVSQNKFKILSFCRRTLKFKGCNRSRTKIGYMK